jgi:PPE-repeat protein
MATSGTATFNLDLNNLVEEAFERCGQELRTGYDLRTARRSLNLLSIEWANRGINLWTVEQNQIVMNTQQAIYALPIDTIDILDAVTRTSNGSQSNQTDINLSRISEPTYITIPNKNANGRPIQMYVNRQTGGVSKIPQTTLNGGISAVDTTITLANAANLPTQGFINIGSETIGYQNIVGNQIVNAWRGQNGTTAAAHLTGANVFTNQLPCINVWPTPNPPGDQYTLVYYRMRRIQDAGGGGTTDQDIPFRLLPCMVAGLAFYMSQKLPDALPRMQFLKQEYEEQWLIASTEDREKAASRFVPRNLFYS